MFLLSDIKSKQQQLSTVSNDPHIIHIRNNSTALQVYIVCAVHCMVIVRMDTYVGYVVVVVVVVVGGVH